MRVLRGNYGGLLDIGGAADIRDSLDPRVFVSNGWRPYRECHRA